MEDKNIVLPSQPKVIEEGDVKGRYQIDGLYPGYGHTLGNSLRRIVLSSLQGAAITSVKIDGVSHEFSVIDGVKEDVVAILLNLKQVRFEMHTDEPQTIGLSVKGDKKVTAEDIVPSGQLTIVNPDQHIATLTDKKSELSMEIVVERGVGYVPKEVGKQGKVDIGSIALDAIYTPIRRVNYEVENMRVGDRTDFNKLTFFIETDGTITPREALERSIKIMINQLKAIVGFKEDEEEEEEEEVKTEEKTSDDDSESEFLKTRIEDLDLSQRTLNALTGANIRTVGGLVRKKESDILEVDGLGNKGLNEIKKILKKNKTELRE